MELSADCDGRVRFLGVFAGVGSMERGSNAVAERKFPDDTVTSVSESTNGATLAPDRPVNDCCLPSALRFSEDNRGNGDGGDEGGEKFWFPKRFCRVFCDLCGVKAIGALSSLKTEGLKLIWRVE